MKGPLTINGYYHMPAEDAAGFTPDGWCRTGDLGFLDERGGLWIRGRKKQIIRVGGYTVIPNEIEELVAQLPGVAQAVAIGMPDPVRGEAVWLVLQPRQGETIDVNAALAVCKAVEPYGLFFFEEPLHYTDPWGYSELCQATEVPIAGGECLTAMYEWRVFAERDCFDIGQPDASFTGGLSEFLRVAEMLHARGKGVATHAWGAAVGLAATIQFLAALPDQPPSLFPFSPMLEFEQEENPFRDHLALEPIRQVEGRVKVPTGPGLGIEIDRTVIDRHRVA